MKNTLERLAISTHIEIRNTKWRLTPNKINKNSYSAIPIYVVTYMMQYECFQQKNTEPSKNESRKRDKAYDRTRSQQGSDIKMIKQTI